jgi:dihydrofolate synthase/folylpolyglutamate synthase
VERLAPSGHGENFRVTGRLREYNSLEVPLLGRHQVLNAVTAIAVAELLEEKGFEIGEARIREGLVATSCPGRLQFVSARPRILVDGAHNPAGMRALRAFLEEEKLAGRLLVVFGVLKDKAWDQMLRILAPLTAAIILTRPESDRSAEPKELATVASDYLQEVRIAETVPEALTLACALVASDDTILVTGSLYTAAAALRALGFTSIF